MGGRTAEQLTFVLSALAEAHAANRALTEQLGAANATIAKIATEDHALAHLPPITVRDLWERYRQAHERDAKSWVTTRNRLLPFVEHFGDRIASTLRAKHWAPFRSMRLDQHIRGGTDPAKKRKMAPLTINCELGWVKAMFNWAVNPEQELLEVNPFASVKRQKCRKRRETWITEADAQRVLKALAKQPRHIQIVMRAFILLMLDCGLRFNEARGARIDRLRVREDQKATITVDRTKNGRSHTVALTARVVEALAECEVVDGSVLFFGRVRRRWRGNGDLVVALWSERQMRRWFRDACEASGIDAKVADGDVRLRPHDLRHSAATNALRRGATLKAIQRMLNHAHPQTTLIYLHDDEDDLVATAAIMEAGIRREAKRAPRRRKSPKRAPQVATTKKVVDADFGQA